VGRFLHKKNLQSCILQGSYEGQNCGRFLCVQCCIFDYRHLLHMCFARTKKYNSFCMPGMAVREGQSNYTIPNDKLYQSKKLHSTILNAANDELNIYDFNARQYDPVIGRFTSLDPMEQFFSGYVGIGNDWANLVDPTGMIAQPLENARWVGPSITLQSISSIGPRLLPVSITNLPDGGDFLQAGSISFGGLGSFGVEIGSALEWGSSGPGGYGGGSIGNELSAYNGLGPNKGGMIGSGSGGVGGGSSISNTSNYGESPEDRFKREQEQIKAFNGRQNANQQSRDQGNAVAGSSPINQAEFIKKLRAPEYLMQPVSPTQYYLKRNPDFNPSVHKRGTILQINGNITNPITSSPADNDAVNAFINTDNVSRVDYIDMTFPEHVNNQVTVFTPPKRPAITREWPNFNKTATSSAASVTYVPTNISVIYLKTAPYVTLPATYSITLAAVIAKARAAGTTRLALSISPLYSKRATSGSSIIDPFDPLSPTYYEATFNLLNTSWRRDLLKAGINLRIKP
jgi:RHS repeat-associated protein